MALSGSFLEFRVAGDQKASLPVFLCSPACSSTWRAPLPGALLWCSAHQAHRAPVAGVLFYSSVYQARGGPASLLFSCWCWCLGRARLWWWLRPVCMTQQYRFASMAFLHQHFPPQSPPSHPLNPSLLIQQQRSPWDFSIIHKLQLPATAPSRGPAFLSGVCMAVARTVWFSFHLDRHKSAVSFSALNASPLTQTVALIGHWTPASVSPPTEGRSSPTNSPVFLPSSFVLASFACFSILFSTDQVLLTALNWCSACISVSEAVFRTYL